MKKSANIVVLAFAFLALQACGSKSNETKPEVTAPVTQVKALTVKEKREKLEKERIARETRINQEREELAKTKRTYVDAKGNVIYYKAELQPMFTGGPQALSNYLNNNLKFPDAARDNGAEGTVFVDFVVSKDGIVRDVEVSDGYNLDIDQSFRVEAFRVVSAMPRWKAGSQNGKNVDVKYSLPVTFELR